MVKLVKSAINLIEIIRKVSYFLYSFDLVYSFPKNHLLQHKIITR
nr:MAG TPA: hypothetical protein [Caudoviricetes sp.]